MFLKKIKNNFLVCDQHKIMQRIVCFLSSSKMLVYPPCKTLPLNLLISLAFFTSRLLEVPYIHFSCILVAQCSAPCSLVLYSTAAKLFSVISQLLT